MKNRVIILRISGKTYRSESGKWSWVVTENDDVIAKQTGYDTEDDADKEMTEEMYYHLTRDRIY